jgi:hypothetical protein
MELHRLRPTSLSHTGSRYRGRCAACGQPLRSRQQVVHLYGEAFHHGCAFYRSLRNRAPQDGRVRDA